MRRTPSTDTAAPAARFMLATLVLALGAVHLAPTAAAERCHSEWYGGYCSTCPGPGHHPNCQNCYWSDAVYCSEGPSCEYSCGSCEPGQSQGEVYECRCEGNANCGWYQTCEDQDGDMRCDDGSRGANRGGNECTDCLSLSPVECASSEEASPRARAHDVVSRLTSTEAVTSFDFGDTCE